MHISEMSLILLTRQTKASTCVDLGETACPSCLIFGSTPFASLSFFFRLKSIAASVEKSKFKKGKVLFRKSGMKVFKARADKTPKSAEHLEWDQRLFQSSIATIIFNSFANGNYKILEGLSACVG